KKLSRYLSRYIPPAEKSRIAPPSNCNLYARSTSPALSFSDLWSQRRLAAAVVDTWDPTRYVSALSGVSLNALDKTADQFNRNAPPDRNKCSLFKVELMIYWWFQRIRTARSFSSSPSRTSASLISI